MDDDSDTSNSDYGSTTSSDSYEMEDPIDSNSDGELDNPRKPFVLNEAGPCTSTRCCDEKKVTNRECYITANARVKEIRVEDRNLLCCQRAQSMPRRNFEDIARPDLSDYEPRNDPVARASPEPSRTPKRAAGSNICIRFPAVRRQQGKKRRLNNDGCIAKRYYPGLAFNCGANKIQLNDCDASYDKFEHTFRPRRSAFSSDNSSYVHIARAAAVPENEPREFSCPRYFSLHSPRG